MVVNNNFITAFKISLYIDSLTQKIIYMIFELDIGLFIFQNNNNLGLCMSAMWHFKFVNWALIW